MLFRFCQSLRHCLWPPEAPLHSCCILAARKYALNRSDRETICCQGWQGRTWLFGRSSWRGFPPCWWPKSKMFQSWPTHLPTLQTQQQWRRRQFYTSFQSLECWLCSKYPRCRIVGDCHSRGWTFRRTTHSALWWRRDFLWQYHVRRRLFCPFRRFTCDCAAYSKLTFNYQLWWVIKYKWNNDWHLKTN